LTSVEVTLLAKQKKFMRSDARITIFLGGIGSGKTYIGAIWSVLQALKSRKVIVLEPTVQMGRDVFLPTLREVLELLGKVEDTDYVVNLSSLTIRFVRGGGEILIRSAEAAERLRGINAHDALVDEFGSHPNNNAYKILLGRLRKSADAKIRMVGTPTPVKWIRDVMADAGVEVIRQTTMENVFLPDNYVQSLKDQYGEGSLWYRQEILGEIVDFGGTIVDTSRITILPFYNAPTGRLVRAWDTASSSRSTADFTASALIGVSETTGQVIIYDVSQEKGAYAQLKASIIQRMLTDPQGTQQVFEDSPGGQVIISDLQADPRCRGLAIWPIHATHDKVTRVLPFSSRVQAGLVSMNPGTFVRPCLDELSTFPACDHDDQVDAIAHAYNHLTQNVGRGLRIPNLY
jgi:predicted phage terminase large subunit-like protein